MKDLYVGVPVIIGAGGVERIVEVNLTATEKKGFMKSVASVKGLVDACIKINPEVAKGKTAAKPKARVKAK